MANVRIKMSKKMPNLGDFFSALDSLNPESNDIKSSNIIYPKFYEYHNIFNNLKIDLGKIYNLLKKQNITYRYMPEFLLGFLRLRRELCSYDFKQFESSIDIMSLKPSLLIDMKKKYYKLKNSQLILDLIKLGINIARSKIQISNVSNFTYKCHSNLTGLVLFDNINVFRQININYCEYEIDDMKDIFNSSIPKTELIRETIFDLLINIYVKCKRINELRKQPDIDVDDFFDQFKIVFDSIKKSMSECREGFNIISDSKDLFKKNFNEYYSNFISSGDPSSLITDFLEDVIKENIISINTKDNELSRVTDKKKTTASSIIQLRKIFNKVKETVIKKMKNNKDFQMSENATELIYTIDNYFDIFDKVDENEPDEETRCDLMKEFQQRFNIDI